MPLVIARSESDEATQICALDWIASLALRDRKSTRLNSSHTVISYAVFCLKKKTEPCLGGRYTLSGGQVTRFAPLVRLALLVHLARFARFAPLVLLALSARLALLVHLARSF